MHMTTTYHWTLTMRQLSSPFRPTFALPWLQANNASLINSLSILLYLDTISYIYKLERASFVDREWRKRSSLHTIFTSPLAWGGVRRTTKNMILKPHAKKKKKMTLLFLSQACQRLFFLLWVFPALTRIL